jgi:hypothetical protein
MKNLTKRKHSSITEELEIQFDSTRKIVYIHFKGLVNFNTIQSAYKNCVSDKNFDEDMGRIWDFSAADLTPLSGRAIMSLAGYFKNFAKKSNLSIVALVVNKTIDYGMMRMFQGFINDAIRSEIFWSVEEAEIYLLQKTGKSK